MAMVCGGVVVMHDFGNYRKLRHDDRGEQKRVEGEAQILRDFEVFQ